MDAFLPFLSSYGYIALFILVLVGGTYVPIPAGAVLMFVGAISHHHPVHLAISFCVALAASITDDLIIYSIARKLGRKAGYERFLEKHQHAQKLEDSMLKYPELAILGSRFIGFVSMPVNALAGLSRMKLRTFIPLAALGDAICIVLYLAAGYLIGNAWEKDARIAEMLISAILVLFAVIMAGSYLFFRRKRSPEQP